MRIAVFVLPLALAACEPARGRSDATAADAHSPGAVDEQPSETFDRRLREYLQLRQSLAETIGPLESTDSAAELATRQAALTTAIQQARRDAAPGNLVPAPVADEMRAIVRRDLAERALPIHDASDEETPDHVTLAINRAYPPEAALPTVPPLLLAKLPKLPDNLQYRLVERDLVILDGDTQLVVDIVTGVVPAP